MEDPRVLSGYAFGQALRKQASLQALRLIPARLARFGNQLSGRAVTKALGELETAVKGGAGLRLLDGAALRVERARRAQALARKHTGMVGGGALAGGLGVNLLGSRRQEP